MKRIPLLLMFLSIISLPIGAKDDIDLGYNNPPTNKENKNPRSIIIPVVASLDSDKLVILFDEFVSSRVMIEDTIQNSVIIDQTYPASTSIQVDLLTLPSGSYYLYIYAYDCWWLGEFELY